MDRKGQTWQSRVTVLTVLRSYRPTPGRRHWVHTVVFLEHPRAEYVGAKHVLDEAIDEPFEGYKDMKRLA